MILIRDAEDCDSSDVHMLLVFSADCAKENGTPAAAWLEGLEGRVGDDSFEAARHVAALVWSGFLDEDEEIDIDVSVAEDS